MAETAVSEIHVPALMDGEKIVVLGQLTHEARLAATGWAKMLNTDKI